MRKRNDGHCYSNDKYLANWWQRSRLADNGCWEWTGPTRKTSDHADVCFRGVVMLLHRAAYLLFFGPIPEGREIHHNCFNARCWRPDHLEPLTDQQHNALHRGRVPKFCRHGHAMTPENQLRRSDQKENVRCRRCAALARNQWEAKRREYRNAYRRRKRAEKAGQKEP